MNSILQTIEEIILYLHPRTFKTAQNNECYFLNLLYET
jgi:hypothetical protein